MEIVTGQCAEHAALGRAEKEEDRSDEQARYNNCRNRHSRGAQLVLALLMALLRHASVLVGRGDRGSPGAGDNAVHSSADFAYKSGT